MAFFKKEELKLLWPFYFDQLFITLFYLYPIFYVLYFRDINFSLTQIGFLISVYTLASIIFEIPTGAIADLFGRKLSTVLGQFLIGISMFFVLFSSNFYVILILFFIRGAFASLVSGADEAWVVDLLKYKKRKLLIPEFFSKNHSFMSFGIVVGGIIGAILVQHFGLWIIWPMSGACFILSGCILLFAEEHFVRIKRKTNIKNIIIHSKKPIHYSLQHPVISLLLPAGMIYAVTMIMSGDITWQPLLQSLGLKEYLFGYLISASFILEIFVPYANKPLSKIFGGYRNYLIFLLILQTLFLFSAFFIYDTFTGIFIFLLYTATFGFYFPSRSTFFQSFVPTKKRATIGSLSNMSFSITATIAAPIAGFVADKLGPKNMIIISGFFLIVNSTSL